MVVGKDSKSLPKTLFLSIRPRVFRREESAGAKNSGCFHLHFGRIRIQSASSQTAVSRPRNLQDKSTMPLLWENLWNMMSVSDEQHCTDTNCAILPLGYLLLAVDSYFDVQWVLFPSHHTEKRCGITIRLF